MTNLIIESLFNFIYDFLFNHLFTFTVPSLDAYDDIVYSIDYFLDYGIDVYQYFIPVAAQVMLTIVVASEVVVEAYFFIMWIVKKIPIINVD